MNKFENIELLAPAGDISKLETALYFGADAVYLGGKAFGLRASAGNFDDEELANSVAAAHARGRKVYITVNVYARNDEFADLVKYVKYLESIKVDAVIVSNLGVLKIIRENTDLEIHISTQANITDKYTAEEYIRLGASRVILARELPIEEIAGIAKHLSTLKTCKGLAPSVECFVHGALCISYSGRCLLSNYLTGRDSNRGACAQPCRWKYALVEEKRPGEYLPITEDARGTYIMNSKDLCLINRLSELANAGVTSFKIEGRMKSEYYVAGVVNTYRRAMRGEKFDFVAELEKLSHRKFTAGTTFADDEIKQHYESAAPIQSHEVVAIVTGERTERGCQIEQRNNFAVGETLEILSPTDSFNKTFTVTDLTNTKGEKVERAKLVQETLFMPCPFELHIGDILRKPILK
jgi:putative protease